MAQINKPTDYFNTVLYSGTGSDQSVTGTGFATDWLWIKERNGADAHFVNDSVRGKGTNNHYLNIFTNATTAEVDQTTGVNAINSNGFDITYRAELNESGKNYVAWNWLGAGTSPSKTYVVKVVDDSGNKYRFDDFGTSAVTLELSEGGTYTFDQSDSSNSGHPLRFYTASDKTGGEYTTGVTTNGTPGSSGAYTRITVAGSAPTLYYQCSAHAGMGGQANTPTTNSFSDFSGSIQSNISPNTTAGFSIVSWTGNGTSGATVGHGISTPDVIIAKSRSGAHNWYVYHKSNGVGYGKLNLTDAFNSATDVFTVAPTSSVFTISADTSINNSGDNFIAYCFAEKKGYSKFGTYVGNGNANGTFIYTGFKPAFVVTKRTNSTSTWLIMDNKRDSFNVAKSRLFANASDAENTTANIMDLNSNGFKIRNDGTETNISGSTYIYMAFAENPLVGTNNIPATAR